MTRTDISRRDFIGSVSSAPIVLLIGGRLGAIESLVRAGTAATVLAPNQWIAIDQSGTIALWAHKSEMGQGVRTSLPAILAAELGADWKHVMVRHAGPGLQFPDMGTSGSGSVEDSWLMLRRAAATARTMLIRAAAQQWSVPEAECSAAQSIVSHRSSGRSARFGDLVAAAASQPVPASAPLRPDGDLAMLGQRLRRVDTPAIVEGRATYGIDVRIPGMRFAVLARPPIPGAAVASVKEAQARAIPGVVDVVRTPSGVAIVASNSWAAMRGRTALDVRWSLDRQPGANTAAFIGHLTSALGEGKVSRREGDFARAAIGAGRTIEATYTTAFQAHAALEPLTCVVDPRPDRCEIWVGTQRPNGVRRLAAQIMAMPEEQVTVHVVLMGGAFGRRIATDHAREAIELAKAIKGPVQLLWSREDDFAHDMFQPAQVNHIAAAIAADGSLLGWRQRVADYHLSMFGALNPNANPAEDEDPWGGYDSPYVFPAMDLTLATVQAPVPTGAWRSVTYPAGVFARECFLDEIAHAVNEDPLTLRLELLARSPNQPAHRNAGRTAQRLSHVLSLAAARANWHHPRQWQQDGRQWGRGIACNPYHMDGAMVAQVADASVGSGGDIRVHRVITAIDVGRVIDRSGLEAQVEGGVGWALSAALHTQITFTDGRADQTNYHQYPVLRMRDMPVQEIIVVENDALPPFGAGEPPVPAVFAAVANAVFAATRRRLREIPLRLTPQTARD
jgi:isoquinoline 1-oxidoreductase beta subunit